MYNLKKNIISHDDIEILKNHIKTNYYNKIQNFNNPTTGHNKSEINVQIDKNDKYFNKILSKYIKYEDNEDFTYIFIKYINDGFCKPHYDGGCIKTILILLTDTFIGGEFLIEDKIINFKKSDIVSFTSDMKHEIKKIISGNREVIVVQVYDKIKEQTKRYNNIKKQLI